MSKAPHEKLSSPCNILVIALKGDNKTYTLFLLPLWRAHKMTRGRGLVGRLHPKPHDGALFS